MSLLLNNDEQIENQFQNNNDIKTQEFITLYKKGKLEDVEYFFNTNPEINNNENIEKAFRIVCRDGYLDIAKWLFKKENNVLK